MPVKRRLAKARKPMDEDKIQDQFYGPGTCLFNGSGYCGELASSNLWRELTPAEQATVLEAMRDDWQRHSATVMAAWRVRTPHELYCAREYHGDPRRPWAATEFGTEG